MRSPNWAVSYNNGGSDVLAACMTLKLLVPGEESSFDVYICAMVKSRYIGDGHPTFNRESF